MKPFILLFSLMFVLLIGFTTTPTKGSERKPAFHTPKDIRLKILKARVKYLTELTRE